MTNIAFSRIVRLSDRQWEFNFRKLPGDMPNFHVDVTDAKGDRIQFSMYKDAHGRWHTTGRSLPLWIANEEEVLGATIEEGIAI
ncbi:MAG: hypothetical protein ABI415_05910 [Flavitalea sp.]